MALAVSVMTPDRLLLQTSVDFVVVPCVDGEVGLLTHHAPLIAQLKPGAVRLQEKDRAEFFAVSGGFVEVYKDSISILAETAELAKEIDVERARQAADRAKQAMASPTGNSDPFALETALLRALVRIRVFETWKRAQKVSFTVEK